MPSREPQTLALSNYLLEVGSRLVKLYLQAVRTFGPQAITKFQVGMSTRSN